MTFAEELTQLLKQPNGEEKVRQHIRQLLTDPATRHEIAVISNFNTQPTKKETL